MCYGERSSFIKLWSDLLLLARAPGLLWLLAAPSVKYLMCLLFLISSTQDRGWEVAGESAKVPLTGVNRIKWGEVKILFFNSIKHIKNNISYNFC